MEPNKMADDTEASSNEIEEALWGLEDYAVWVPMSDNFYKTLVFQKITLEQFKKGAYPPQRKYADSRTYLRHVLTHLGRDSDAVQIFDIGGYIGRFSIESALTCRELDVEYPIYCFEPGATSDMLRRNLELNSVQDLVQLNTCAISNKSDSVRFAVPHHAKISSRIVVGKAHEDRYIEQGFEISDIPTQPLSAFMEKSTPFIAKIDTEGHEADVINGIPIQTLTNVPHVLVVEFWPEILKKKIHERDFTEFVFENYDVLNIVSSLYPRNYEPLHDFKEVTQQIESKAINNIDLMFVSKTIPERAAMLQAIIT